MKDSPKKSSVRSRGAKKDSAKEGSDEGARKTRATPAAADDTLRKGMRGPRVEELQRDLAVRGYLVLPGRMDPLDAEIPRVDDPVVPLAAELGFFDDATEEAVRLYQLDYLLPISGKDDDSTRYMRSLPYCAFQPESLLTMRAQGKWDKQNITYALEGNTAGGINRTKAMQAFQAAFRLWEEKIPLRFRPTQDVNTADITIRFQSVDGKPLGVLGVAFGLTKVHFDTGERWSDQPVAPSAQGVDLVTVAAHEFGHTLGLAHSSDPTALMWPQPVHRGPHRYLSENDVRRIQTLYGSRSLG